MKDLFELYKNCFTVRFFVNILAYILMIGIIYDFSYFVANMICGFSTNASIDIGICSTSFFTLSSIP